ncbi:poly [ADP-ribose] polymerase 2-like isoform X2 [Hydractinia symbiolongicarpus]|uniref:poly [ADP-ribose] polymerase 2-like isoform X2 n=1 Tax=Hydractinia symbiolongicarpus TaxID=13093 RepID=UPI002549C625|nr:poly [ADP-ribose] polymerase 2-like isoform X2 [Hydractinia symbiolongicarpus]
MATKRAMPLENSTAVKKMKVSEEDICWEWENDGHIWSKFSSTLNDELTLAFKSGLKNIKIMINEAKFDIVFERMVQRNLKTFWERRIRANVDSGDGGLSGTYHYHNGNTWTLLHHSVQRLLFATKLFGLTEVTYAFGGKKYNVDLNSMTQTDNKTKKKQLLKEDVTDVDKNDLNNSNNINAESQKENGATGKVKVEATSDEEEEQPAKKIKKTVTGKKTAKDEDEKPTVKSFSFTGKVPVDTECPVREKYHVYFEGFNIYDAMLNQTNLKNNNNKFFLLQVLQNNKNNGYAVWLRWGRVGMRGQTNLITCGNDCEEAKEIFFKKFYDKTKNEFADRKKFKKVQGKYDLLAMDYGNTKTDTVDGAGKPKKEKKVPESKLEKKLQALVELLCDVKEMEEAVLEMKYDSKKAPLGKLTKAQIKAGYKALQLIDRCITNQKTGDELIKACDAFYTRVPHCFGMQRPPIIRTRKDLKLKIELLETLGDIEIAMKVINDESNKMLNPIDQHYLALRCKLEALSHDTTEFDVVKRYTQNTHAKTHSQYTMEVVDVFEVIESPHNENFKDVGNTMLLWHGSRLTNWVGILSQGLRIAPPEAPVTGYMFGKGIYFADMSSKSANYCYPTRTKNTGFVLLCEVSLGKTNDLLSADFNADNLPPGCHSTKGLGKIAPDEKENITLPNGVVVPLGKQSDTGVINPNGYTLNYNGAIEIPGANKISLLAEQ